MLSAGSAGSVVSFGSLLSAGSLLSIGSSGSILSIGSSGSILSLGSAGSILSLGSSGAFRNRKGPMDGPGGAGTAPVNSAARVLAGGLAVAGLVATLTPRR